MLSLFKTIDTLEKTWLAKSARRSGFQNVNYYVMLFFLLGLLLRFSFFTALFS